MRSAPIPRAVKKKKENRMRAWQTKESGAGLEDFVDWMGIIANEPAKEEEMSSLAARFTARMRKRATSS